MSIGLCARTIFLFGKQVVGYIFKQACCYVFGLDKILPFGNGNAFTFPNGRILSKTEDITTSLLENIPDNLFTKKILFSHTILLTYINNDVGKCKNYPFGIATLQKIHTFASCFS